MKGSMSQHMDSPQSSPHSQQDYYQYLSPQSEHSDGIISHHSSNQVYSFPTPSPDSLGHWNSLSPQSNSDWSEGITSPSTNNTEYI